MTGALDSWKRWTTAATSASSRSSGIARVTSPIRSASAAVRLAPVIRISNARLRPTSRGRSAAATVLKTPPRISGCPSLALLAASTMSHAAARMQPAPSAGPATTASVGLSTLASASKMRRKLSSIM